MESGTEVVWTNNDNVLHSVTGNPHPDGNFDTLIDNGESFAFQFGTVCTYEYGCVLHPWTIGEIEVVDAMMDDLAVQEFVDELIALYMDNGDDAFDMINAMMEVDAELAGYVVDANSNMIVAHIRHRSLWDLMLDLFSIMHYYQ